MQVLAQESFVDASCSADVTCGALALPVLIARMTSGRGPASRFDELCGPWDVAQDTLDQVRTTFGNVLDALMSTDGFARLIGFVMLLGLGVVIGMALMPVIVGLALHRPLLGLVGLLLTVAASVQLAPKYGCNIELVVAAASTIAIALVDRRARWLRPPKQEYRSDDPP